MRPSSASRTSKQSCMQNVSRCVDSAAVRNDDAVNHCACKSADSTSDMQVRMPHALKSESNSAQQRQLRARICKTRKNVLCFCINADRVRAIEPKAKITKQNRQNTHLKDEFEAHLARVLFLHIADHGSHRYFKMIENLKTKSRLRNRELGSLFI